MSNFYTPWPGAGIQRTLGESRGQVARFPQSSGRFVEPARGLRSGRREESEQAVGLIVGASTEDQRVGRADDAVAGHEGPQPVDGDGLAVGAAKRAVEATAPSVVGVDATVAEVADEQIAAEACPSVGGDRQAPRRIELTSPDEPPQEVT